eukprot:gnl/MRDRNA2_/MRDRNA2_158552_c0_seq1.p1 gnl/MRDRNA2_/MRDRNA2_158552_c0~~gnl/MRDRNA2_/MRDRNA2_158552_c0_seq1.p1  ORF type:complete len:231 (-),score=38.30 gnl/MRDRNA2_/MRDRNA2_158552_c0_seq1:366-965(-)
MRHAPCDLCIIKSDFPIGITRWVGISCGNFMSSARALKTALSYSKPGDMVIAVHYPVDLEDDESSVFEKHLKASWDLPRLVDEIKEDIQHECLERAAQVAEEYQATAQGVAFRTFLGRKTAEPHQTLVEDASRLEEKPHTIYLGYNNHVKAVRTVEGSPLKLYDMAEHVVLNAPCNVVVVKEDRFSKEKLPSRPKRSQV